MGRFLQPSNSSSGPQGPLVISPKPVTANAPSQFGSLGNITYRANLTCGECVVGSYVFCVNGPENFTGPVAPRTVCCNNATNCPQARNSSWTCSNKYNTVTEQLRVCPYDASCGSQVLSLDSDDSECVRLKTLKRGTTCVYRVQSKCMSPNLRLNTSDTLVVPEMVLISNTTIPVGGSQNSCTQLQNQQCLCRNVTANNQNRFLCDCDIAKNLTQDSLASCQCTTLRDILGNELRQCNCPIPVPI